MDETLSQRLKRVAITELGFDLAGVTSADPVDGSVHLRRWVDSGRHGEMSWMADTVTVRADPGRVLPGARSVVCVAMSYHDAPEEAPDALGEEEVVVASYARRKDYHRVIKPRLVRLGAYLADQVPGARWRAATDTVPLLEKGLAQRASLGWIGKNTCLINRRLGSELLLGELVTDVVLDPDEAETDHCGSCTDCLGACPTGALTGPYRLDARLCISYLTIEHRSELPAPLLPALGAHLFGCDLCQGVCPWNLRVPGAPAAPLATRPQLASLSLPQLEVLDDAGWRHLSSGSPLRRLDYARFRRNLAVVRTNLDQRSLGERR